MDFPRLPNKKVTGLLRLEEREKIVERLRERGPMQACELCRKMDWQLGTHVISPLPLARGGILMRAPEDPLYPCVSLVCGNCGNTKILNLLALGLGEELLGRLIKHAE